MDVVDAQIHVWEDDHPERPWDPEWRRKLAWMLDCGQAVTIDRAIAAMDAVGITGALVVSFPLYPDVEYALEATDRHPDRFRTVPHIDLEAAHPEEEVERFATLEGVVAIRVAPIIFPGGCERLASGAYQPVFSAAERCGLPVMLAVSGNVLAAEVPARSNPDVQFIVDHLGIAQPHEKHAVPGEPFESLDDLLSLAKYPNLALKFSGLPTLSREPYPYADLWPHLHRAIDAFGLERSMWGSDFSRTRPMHTYAEAVNYVACANELTRDEKERLLGRTLRRMLHWP